MFKFKVGDRVRIKADAPDEIIDNSPTAAESGISTDHTYVPKGSVGTIKELDVFPYVSWDDWRYWAVHEDVLELIQDSSHE